ncbi:uncharacterized protein LOC124116841 isoform X3 [Haliotis rufescens]|uniref:uncharacterized protein LOC124116841 isoform X3 n=1 Tax=Haliotis rufescens TaxID=6454 RepID=UPI00201F5B8D|nr:uncharacterized protein LOC124116841 isoform X3 [Haliotis rufescens]
MASQCIVENCSFKPNSGPIEERPSLHRFPWRTPKLARKWVANVVKSGTPHGRITHSSRVCSLHFENGIRTQESVPSIFNLTKGDTESRSPEQKIPESPDDKNRGKSSAKPTHSPRKRSQPKHCMVLKCSDSFASDEDETHGKTVRIQKKVEKNGFQEHFLSQVSHFWRTRQFCDLCLLVNGHRVLVHQLVFNIARPFCLSTCPVTRQTPMLTITVPFRVSDDAITNFLSYLYEGSLFINEYSVHEILQLGKFFRMTTVMNFCNSFVVVLRRLNVYQPLDERSLRDQGDEGSGGLELEAKHPAVSRKWRSVPKIQTVTCRPHKDEIVRTSDGEYSILADVKIETDNTKDCVNPNHWECEAQFDTVKDADSNPCAKDVDEETSVEDVDQRTFDGIDERTEGVDQRTFDGIDERTEDVDQRTFDGIDERTEGVDQRTFDGIDERTEGVDQRTFDGIDERTEGVDEGMDETTFEVMDERTFEGVDETPFHEVDSEEDAARDSQPHVVSVSWSDDEDQEWVVLPNKDEDNLCEQEEDDNDKIGIGQNTLEQQETFLEAVTMSKDEFEQTVSNDVAEITRHKGRMDEDAHGMACDSGAEDVKPILLPDGTAVDRRGTSAASGRGFGAMDDAKMPNYDGMDDAEMTHYGGPGCTEDVKPVLRPDGSVVHHPGEYKEPGDAEPVITSDPARPVLMFGNGTETATPKPGTEVFEHMNISFRYYKCDRCTSLFTSEARQQEHVQVVHQGVRFKCQFCGREFTSRSGHKLHELDHLGQNPYRKYKCEKCFKSFPSKTGLNNHVTRVCQQFKCQKCKAVFVNFQDHRHHVSNCRRTSAPIECPECHQIFSSKFSLERHSKTHLSPPVFASASKPIKKYQCQVCLKVIIGKARFLQHKGEHSEHLKRTQCSACDQTFKTISAMRRHFKTDHPDSELPTSAKISWRDLRRESPFLEDDVEDEVIEEFPPDQTLICEKLESAEMEVTPEQKRKSKRHRSVQGEVTPQEPKSNCGNTRELSFKTSKSDVVPETTLAGGRSRFLCVECGQSFPYAASLRRHSKSEHPLK